MLTTSSTFVQRGLGICKASEGCVGLFGDLPVSMGTFLMPSERKVRETGGERG